MKSYTSIHDPKDLLTYEFLTKSLGVKKYDETATYSKGALVYHEDATDTYLDSIFEANQDIATAESWTAAHWDTVDLETIIKRSMHLYEPYMEYDGSIAKEVIYMEKCVIFSGSSAFDLGLVDEKWYGTNLDKSKTGSLEISTDKKTWETWDYTAKGADLQSNGKYEVYVRGKGNNNTCDNATPNPNYSTFTTTAPVNLIGKLDWIIDYTAASPVCGDCSNLFGKVGGSPAKIVDASGFTLSANLDPAAALADFFQDCTTLTTPPTLPAIQISEGCYYGFFIGCTSLKTAPELPATTLADYCYQDMFNSCTSLTTLPKLSATTMKKGCYNCMFQDCTGITWGATGTPYRLPATGTGTTASSWNEDMFAGNSGTLPGSETGGEGAGTPSIDTTYYYNPQPEEFVRKGKEYMEVNSGTAPIIGFAVDSNGVLTFTRGSIEYVTHIDKSVIFTSPNTFNLQLSGNAWHGDGTLEYSTDGYTWETYGTTNATTLPAPKLQDNGKYELYLRGKGNTTTISGSGDTTQFTTNSTDRINIKGSLDTLLNCTSTPTTTSIQSLFEGVNIVDASELVMPTNYNSATGKNSHCAMLFKNCTHLTGAPQFPNVTLAEACYRNMFQGCTALTTPPQLPATQLAKSCYQYMFHGSGLTSAPTLPATTLISNCYNSMFRNCGSLTTPPALPAMSLDVCCYSYMFENSGLTTTPVLPATTIGAQSYEHMFQNCTALTAAPALPATTLGQQCYEGMFLGCTGITKIPALPATTISTYGYRQMFEGCTGLKFYPVGTSASESFTIPSTTTVGTSALEYMFRNCTDFPETGGTPVQGTVYGYGDKLPDPYITIETTDGSDFGIQMVSRVSDVDLTKLEWSTDGTTWNEPGAAGPAIAFPVDSEGSPIYVKKVYVRGNGFTHFTSDSGYTRTMTMFCKSSSEYVADPVIKISGELRYLYDKSGEATCGNAGFLFAPLQMGPTDVQAVISDVSELVFPTKLGTDANNGLFAYMFSIPSSNCSQPITQPPQLPATQLTESCYCYMFNGCTSLTAPPELPATQLAPWCYYQMFTGCTGLTSAPALPALTVPSGAYIQMFDGCTSLTTPPATLPATTIEIDNTLTVEGYGDGYEWMFCNCPLTTIPTMPPSITINRTGEYTEETSPLAFYQMFQSNNPSLDFAGTDKSWTCPTIADTSGAANLSNMFEGQTNTDIGHGFADGDGTAVAGRTYSYTNV